MEKVNYGTVEQAVQLAGSIPPSKKKKKISKVERREHLIPRSVHAWNSNFLF